MFPFDDVIMMLLVYRAAAIYVKTGNLVNESHVIWVIFFFYQGPLWLTGIKWDYSMEK